MTLNWIAAASVFLFPLGCTPEMEFLEPCSGSCAVASVEEAASLDLRLCGCILDIMDSDIVSTEGLLNADERKPSFIQLVRIRENQLLEELQLEPQWDNETIGVVGSPALTSVHMPPSASMGFADNPLLDTVHLDAQTSRYPRSYVRFQRSAPNRLQVSCTERCDALSVDITFFAGMPTDQPTELEIGENVEIESLTFDQTDNYPSLDHLMSLPAPTLNILIRTPPPSFTREDAVAYRDYVRAQGSEATFRFCITNDACENF